MFTRTGFARQFRRSKRQVGPNLLSVKNSPTQPNCQYLTPLEEFLAPRTWMNLSFAALKGDSFAYKKTFLGEKQNLTSNISIAIP